VLIFFQLNITKIFELLENFRFAYLLACSEGSRILADSLIRSPKRKPFIKNFTVGVILGCRPALRINTLMLYSYMKTNRFQEEILLGL
jgi:hypothetical protein